jgi:CHASE3 domain sensor protein
MPSSDDRLQELRRQRALVQEQLAWLDREIAAASGQATPAKLVVQIPHHASTRQNLPTTPPAESHEVSEVINSFEEASRSNPADAKQGCIWIFVAALVLFALCVFAFYHYVSLHQSPPVH